MDIQIINYKNKPVIDIQPKWFHKGHENKHNTWYGIYDSDGPRGFVNTILTPKMGYGRMYHEDLDLRNGEPCLHIRYFYPHNWASGRSYIKGVGKLVLDEIESDVSKTRLGIFRRKPVGVISALTDKINMKRLLHQNGYITNDLNSMEHNYSTLFAKRI